MKVIQRMAATRAIAIMACGLSLVPLSAQSNDWMAALQPAAGHDVRILPRQGAKINGRLTRVDADRAVIVTPGGEVMLARADVRQISLRKGSTRAGHMKRGLWIGALVGGGLVALVAGATAGGGGYIGDGANIAAYSAATLAGVTGIGVATGAALPVRYRMIYTAP